MLPAAEITRPGTLIDNQASVSYREVDSTTAYAGWSNVSKVRVGELYQHALTAGSSQQVEAGKAAVFHHRLTNTGNLTDTYHLQVRVDSENSMAETMLDSLNVYIDQNGNGLIDESDAPVSLLINVKPGQQFDLIVVARVSELILDDTALSVSLSADSVEGRQLESVRDTIDVIGETELRLMLSAMPECEVELTPGDVIGFNARLEHVSGPLPRARDVQIDGEIVRGLLIEFPLARQLSVDSADTPLPAYLEAIAVIADVVSGGWQTLNQQSLPIAATTLGWFIPEVNLVAADDGGFTVAWSWRTSINSGTDVDLDYTSRLQIDHNGDGDRNYVSAAQCHQFLIQAEATDTELRFITPGIDVLASAVPVDLSDTGQYIDAMGYPLRPRGNSGIEYDADEHGVYLELRISDDDFKPVQTNADGNRQVPVRVASESTGDELQVILLERVSGSGVFTSVQPVRLMNSAQPGSDLCATTDRTEAAAQQCSLHSVNGDRLHTSISLSATRAKLSDSAYVWSGGIVFDSASLKPVAGAVVAVRDAETGQPVVDPVNFEPLQVVTGLSGFYQFMRLPDGGPYYLQVTTPAGFGFPSAVAPSWFTAHTVSALSYGLHADGGESFMVSIDQPVVLPDIPVDPDDRNTRLVVEKETEATLVMPGEAVSFRVSVTNAGAVALNDVTLIDTPPYGFRFVYGSARLDGRNAAIGKMVGEQLKFEIGTLESGQSVTLDYVMRVSAGGIDGDGINTIMAMGFNDQGVPLMSIPAAAQVEVSMPALLSEQATLFGKVYVDANCNGIQDQGEWPIGGVRMYLEDGSYVITDPDGMFSLYGIRPGAHVLAVDATTMPDGMKLKPVDNLNAADGDSRFVDLAAGEFHRADFASACPEKDTGAVMAEVRARSKAGQEDLLMQQMERFDPDKSRVADPLKSVDSDGGLSGGILDQPGSADARARTVDGEADVASTDTEVALPTAIEEPPTDPTAMVMPTAGEAARSVTAEQARQGTWLWPVGEYSRDGRFMAVVRAGAHPQLFVNDEPVPGTQIGELIVNRREQAQVVAWYGIGLKPGINQLEIRGQDGFGNSRTLASASFKRPTMASQLLLQTAGEPQTIDTGEKLWSIDVVLRDYNNYDAQGISFVTLRASRGQWRHQDVQSREPGHQVRVENGRARVQLLTGALTDSVTVNGVSGRLDARLKLRGQQGKRPLTAAGLVELGIRRSALSSDSERLPATIGVEDVLNVESRLALFVTGTIRGGRQLTLAYDSDKPDSVDLLRDLDPSDYYPVYGDSSTRGYQAQSRSKLFVKIQDGAHSLMWGDYLTDADTDINDLARVQRTLTGLNAVFDNGRTRLRSFVARPEDQRVVEEFRGNGTAMLYQIDGAPLVNNSEVVELLVRDADSPAVVLSTRRLLPVIDYAIDARTGYLKFADTIPSVDENHNPVWVRVSYDTLGTGQAYTVAGFRLMHQWRESLALGLSHTRDENPQNGSRLYSASLSFTPSPRTELNFSVGHMSSFTGDSSGNAARLSVNHRWGRADRNRLSFVWSGAEDGFDNPDTGLRAGAEDIRLEIARKISNTTTLRADANVNKEDSITRRSASLIIEKAIRNWTLQGGMRRRTVETAQDSQAMSSSVFGASRSFNLFDKPASASLLFENDITTLSNYRMTMSARATVKTGVQAYANYQRQSQFDLSDSGLDTVEQSLSAGLESGLGPDTRVYSEYRLNENAGLSSAETASGIRGRYELVPGLLLTPTAELVDPLRAAPAEDGRRLALSIGLSDTRNPNARIHGHAEYRYSTSSDYYGFRGSYLARLSTDTSAVIREEYRFIRPETGEIDLRHRLTLGFAHRPRRDNRHHMLFMYDWKEERGEGDSEDRTVHMFVGQNNLQFNRQTTLSFRWGGKQQKAYLDARSVSSRAYIFDTRVSHDVNRRLRLDLQAGLLATDQWRSRRFSVGIGAGYIIRKNLMLKAAWNQLGFVDKDLDPDGYNRQGFSIGLQYKFNESLLSILEDPG